jgi:hypothetical protein
MTSSHRSAIAAAASLLAIGICGPALAAEGGSGIYLLGFKGPAAGITPPAGWYFENDVYGYTGSAGGTIPLGGGTAVGLKANLVINAATVLWVTPLDIAGGHLGFSATMPFGWAGVTATAGTLGVSDDIFTWADPFVGTFVGWESGNFHWQLGAAFNIPIGDYQSGQLANIAKHIWATDLSFTATWLDPATGWDLSTALGLTINGTNPATNYTNGTEFHLEWAAVKHFSPQWDGGLVGYFYQQLTPDAGAPPILGGFEGRVAAIGATLGYSFKVGEVPVSTRIKYYHEFAVENRLQGDALFLTASFPLGG